MQTTRPGQAFIEVTIARLKDSDVESVHELQHCEQEERPIEAGLQEPVEDTDQTDQSPIEETPVQNGPLEHVIQQNVPEQNAQTSVAKSK